MQKLVRERKRNWRGTTLSKNEYHIFVCKLWLWELTHQFSLVVLSFGNEDLQGVCLLSSIIHDSEFASCLSVNSILRLRATALTAVAQDKSTDESLTDRLASLFIDVSKFEGQKMGRLEAPQNVDSSMRKCHVNDHKSARHCDNDVESNHPNFPTFIIFHLS